MKLSIVIPVYNEAKTIRKLMQRLAQIHFPFQREVILVNDGSTDETAREIEAFRKDAGIPLKVFSFSRNRGKGAAIRFALQHVEGDYLVIQDADLELDPEDIQGLTDRASKEDIEVVYGSRFTAHTKSPSVPVATWVANRFLTGYTNLLFGSRLTDMATCYKLIRTETMRRIRLRCVGFEFEPEITAKILRLGCRIVEVPVAYTPRSRDEGKKIGWRDGIKYLSVLTRYRMARKESFLLP